MRLILGKLAVGCTEIALCESKFEKGEDVTPYIARINAILPKIRRKGDPSVEFAAIGIQCKNLMCCGDARQALTLLDLHRRHLAQSKILERKRIIANLSGPIASSPRVIDMPPKRRMRRRCRPCDRS